MHLEASRLRQAWRGASEAAVKASQIKKAGDDADDLDELLGKEDLDRLADNF